LSDDIGVEFQRWYDEAKKLVSYIGTEEEMLRVPRVQCNRSNVPAGTLLYYKRTIGIPFLLISYCNGCRIISLPTTAGQ